MQGVEVRHPLTEDRVNHSPACLDNVDAVKVSNRRSWCSTGSSEARHNRGYDEAAGKTGGTGYER